MNQAKISALHIIERAAFSMLDLGDKVDSLPGHVGCAYDCWVSDMREIVAGRLIATDKHKAEVQRVLEAAGLGW